MAVQHYTTIGIIYNPNSTSGLAEDKAKHLAGLLKKRNKRIKLIATKFAGHAEEIAYELATQHKHPLIVSVSGDGGYNEVINGVMHAIDEGLANRPVCAILAAGNANDHSRSVRRKPLSQAIVHDAPEPIDILRLTTSGTKIPIRRYAHSYVGFGISSHAAIELNKNHLNYWNELVIVARNIFQYKPFAILTPDGSKVRLDNLVFANIHQMAKVFRMGEETDLHDGKFEVAIFPHKRNPLSRSFSLIALAVRGFKNPPKERSYSFVLPQTEFAHCDGEVVKIPGGSKVTIESVQAAILTVH